MARMTDADPLLRYRFTVRQRQVLRRIGAGMGYRAIAAELGIAVSTVKVHAQQVAVRIGYSHLPTLSAVRQFAHEQTTKPAA